MNVLFEIDGVSLEGADLCGLEPIESLMMATFAANIMRLMNEQGIPRHIAAAGVSVVFGAMPTDLRERFTPMVESLTAYRHAKGASQNAPGGQA